MSKNSAINFLEKIDSMRSVTHVGNAFLNFCGISIGLGGEIPNQFASKLLSNTKDLEPEIQEKINEKFKKLL